MKRVQTIYQHLTAANNNNNDRRVLKGLKVIELATVIAGPACCAILADWGADVIKVESIKNPDLVRSWGKGDNKEKTADPNLWATKEGGGSTFTQLNRGKRGLAVDIKKPEGVIILKRLIATADIFVTNVRLKSLRKRGLDYETLSKKFPRLIYAHLSAYGRTGPKVDDPGYDFGAFWAHTGLQELVRSSDNADLPRFPSGIGDNTTAVQMAASIGTALFHRERTGRGQLVDACLMRTGIWSLAHPLTSYAGGTKWATDKTGTNALRGTTKLGERRQIFTSSPFRCQDGVFCYFLGLEFNRHWEKTLDALGISKEKIFPKDIETPDWARICRIIDAVMDTKTYDEWHKIFVEKDVWHARINKFEDMFEDAQANAAGTFIHVEGARHKLIGCPILLSDNGTITSTLAPSHGQHTKSVLKEIGYSDEDINRFQKQILVK